MDSGLIIAEAPVIKVKFRTFAPTIFPIERSATFFLAEVTAVTSSGNEVPIATAVKPMISEGILSASAIAIPEFTRSLLPTITSTAPTCPFCRPAEVKKTKEISKKA